MRQMTIRGIDTAKQVFQLHGVDAHGNVVLHKRVTRTQVLPLLAQVPRLCRKVGFWRQNPKVGSRKINYLRVSTFLFSVICDRAHTRPLGPVEEVDEVVVLKPNPLNL